MDEMVLEAQKWVNATYRNHPQYEVIPENGNTGWSTVYALTRGLQIELGITTLSDNFGPTTLSMLSQKYPYISVGDNTPTNIVKIIQCGLYCKGYPGGDGISGVYSSNTAEGIKKMEIDMGLNSKTADGAVTPKVFKALLTMDAYVVLGEDTAHKEKVRSVQQWLNAKYINRENFFFMPCDGLYSRGTQKALVYAIQYEEGLSDSIANGNFGPTTQSLLPKLDVGDFDDTTSFVHLFEAAMIFNNYDVPFDGVFSSSLSSMVTAFQIFAALPITGIGDFQTWASLLVSTGDPTRKGTACDSISEITEERALTLKNGGYKTIGRYLTNSKGSSLNKKIQPNELKTILESGLSVFPIYQTYGGEASYFNEGQGRKDALAAYNAAFEYGFETNTIIYFAVDFDALDSEITDSVLPHFKGINDKMRELGGIYKIGIYGTRNVCTRVSEMGYATTSFVSGMSTGWSGNLGYPLPTNWAFDQISTITVGDQDGRIEIDNDISSGKDTGVRIINPHPTDPITKQNKAFFDQLDQIYKIANEQDGFIPDDNKLVAQYYRYKKYYGALWDKVAGSIDSSFIDKVNNQLDDPEIEQLIDPGIKINLDVEHFAATLNSILYKGITVFSDLAGWGGDLLTVCGDVVNLKDEYSSPYDAALDLIGGSKGTFGLADLLADTDAINIGSDINDNVLRLDDVIKDYYTSVYKKRFSKFLENRFSGDYEIVYDQANAILNSQDPIYLTIREEFQNHFHVPPYTKEEGEQVAGAFRDIIKMKVNSE